MAQRYGQLGADDKAGIFIGDGSYLFVPDNKSYDGAKRLLFDEHNHPVSKEEEVKRTPAHAARGIAVTGRSFSCIAIGRPSGL